MRSTIRVLAAVACAFAASQALAMERQVQGHQGSDATEPTPRAVPSGGRWAAAVDHRDESTGLLITDLVSGQTWRLADFEAIGVRNAHWLGPDSLEVDFENTELLLLVRAPVGDAPPSFHLVTTEFNVQGVGRVDYFSPPLAVHYDVSRPKIDTLELSGAN